MVDIDETPKKLQIDVVLKDRNSITIHRISEKPSADVYQLGTILSIIHQIFKTFPTDVD